MSKTKMVSWEQDGNYEIPSKKRTNKFRLEGSTTTIYLSDGEIAFMRYLEEKDRKKAELERRCPIWSEKQHCFVKCRKNCSLCGLKQCGKPLSLDSMRISPDSDESIEVPDKSINVAEEAGRNVDVELLHKAAEHLDEVDKKIFDLYTQCFTEREISAKTKIPDSTVHDRIKGLTKKLKKIIEDFNK